MLVEAELAALVLRAPFGSVDVNCGRRLVLVEAESYWHSPWALAGPGMYCAEWT